MRLQLQRVEIAFSFIVLLSVLFEFCTSNNANWTSSRDKKMRIVRKLRKDFRKLKKQEGALKLIGGENGEHEGSTRTHFMRDLILKIFNIEQTTAENIVEKRMTLEVKDST